MKKKVLFIFLAVFFLSSEVFAAQMIYFEKMSHDFGDVVQGETAEQVFQFENIGDSFLIIEKLGST